MDRLLSVRERKLGGDDWRRGESMVLDLTGRIEERWAVELVGGGRLCEVLSYKRQCSD